MLNRLRIAKLTVHPLRRASTTVEAPKSSDADFFENKRRQFEGHLKEFEDATREVMKTRKVFQHTLDSKERPVNFSTIRSVQLMMDVVGPEQVSPHYENLFTSRRLAITTIGSLMGMSYLMKVSDFNWILASTYSTFFFFMINYYFVWERVKFTMM